MTYIHGCSALVGTVYNFPYSDTREANGSTKTWTAPCTGKFKIELWGAKGGDANNNSTWRGGYGGYTTGVLSINKDVTMYVYVGEAGVPTASKNAFNGGGYCGIKVVSSWFAAGGGGSTDIRTRNGNWKDATSLSSRLMVASAGGGGSYEGNTVYSGVGGAAGGLKGFIGTSLGSNALSHYGHPGTQVSGGYSHHDTSVGVAGFGYGGDSYSTEAGAGGGSGYWGGGGASNSSAGGGGSSYISGYKGCVAIISASSTSPRKNSSGTTCTESLAASDVSCSYHYSGYIFTDTVMKAGNEVMPAPGGGNETGHSGNGYARITIVE